ncbi:hypothetical protein JXB28_03505 [Candidatus Woesearchaeota archaeon]|nr:hypothetical protein [Candidatus Woesearchaeota archaeon]
MVKIADKDFNKELMGYIGKRRSMEKKGFRIRFPSQRKVETVPDVEPGEVKVEYKQPGFLGKLFSFRRGMIKEAERSEDLSPEDMAKLRAMEDDIEETEHKIMEKEEEVREIKQEEEELVQKRESMLTSFFSKINVFKRRRMDDETEVPEDEIENVPALDPDVINVLKSMHKWLNELPPAKKRDFKNSSDFKDYKAVLEKYELVRKKE